MTTALQSALYKQHVGVDYLSKTFESDVLHSPEILDRLSISQQHFDNYRSRTYRAPKMPWGRSMSYGGTGPINLPEDHRPKQEPPVRVQKGHRHFGGGIFPFPRGLPSAQYYDLTLLKKSNLRRNDELIPDCQKLDIGKFMIPLKFPSEHPYQSHIPKFALYPSFDSPDDVRKGREATICSPTLPPTAAASAVDPAVVEKTKGHFDRREVVQVQRESEKTPLVWNEHNYYQLVKGPALQRQVFYPTPPSSVQPNSLNRPPELTVSPRTANALYNLQKSYWKTIYSQQHTGNGTQNILKLDDHDEVCSGEGDDLKEHFRNQFTPPRPLEGRHTSIRNNKNSKKKKRIIVGHGTELWVTDDEEEEDTNQVKTSEKSVISVQKPLIPDDDREPWSYSNNNHHLINQEGSKYQLNTSKISNGYYQPANPPETPPSLAYLEYPITSYYHCNNRPGTAPEPSRPCSPTIHNMPSQLHDQTKTGTTKSDFYPKWFRKSAVYGPKRPSTALMELQNNWSRTEAHQKFHEQFPENAPDIRRKPDLRVTTNERRHVIPETGIHVYYYHR